MTEIKATLTLDEEANPSIIRELLENIKGVIKVSFNKEGTILDRGNEEAEERIKILHQLQKNIDRSVIDMNDERTRYIMR